LNARAEAYAEIGRWEEAASDFSKSHEVHPSDPGSRIGLAFINLAKNDTNGFRQSCARLLQDFRRLKEPDLAIEVARLCVSAPLSATEGESAIRLARRSPTALAIVGAAQFRAGKHADAVKSLERALQPKDERDDPTEPVGGTSLLGCPDDDAGILLFLAMSHQRLGHVAESRHSLQKATFAMDRLARANAIAASPRPRLGWRDRLALSALRCEAEAVILYDPIFPADPFAH
jgi:tetratricopeptide (TPR) repeat protein